MFDVLEEVNQITDGRMRMAKQVDELFEAPEAEEQPAKKINMHVVIALRHLNKRRGVLLEKRAAVTKEIEELDRPSSRWSRLSSNPTGKESRSNARAHSGPPWGGPFVFLGCKKKRPGGNQRRFFSSIPTRDGRREHVVETLNALVGYQSL